MWVSYWSSASCSNFLGFLGQHSHWYMPLSLDTGGIFWGKLSRSGDVIWRSEPVLDLLALCVLVDAWLICGESIEISKSDEGEKDATGECRSCVVKLLAAETRLEAPNEFDHPVPADEANEDPVEALCIPRSGWNFELMAGEYRDEYCDPLGDLSSVEAPFGGEDALRLEPAKVLCCRGYEFGLGGVSEPKFKCPILEDGISSICKSLSIRSSLFLDRRGRSRKSSQESPERMDILVPLRIRSENESSLGPNDEPSWSGFRYSIEGWKTGGCNSGERAILAKREFGVPHSDFDGSTPIAIGLDIEGKFLVGKRVESLSRETGPSSTALNVLRWLFQERPGVSFRITSWS